MHVVPLIVLWNWHGAPEPDTRFSIGAAGRKELISLAACVIKRACKEEGRMPSLCLAEKGAVVSKLGAPYCPVNDPTHFSVDQKGNEGFHRALSGIPDLGLGTGSLFLDSWTASSCICPGVRQKQPSIKHCTVFRKTAIRFAGFASLSL